MMFFVVLQWCLHCSGRHLWRSGTFGAAAADAFVWRSGAAASRKRLRCKDRRLWRSNECAFYAARGAFGATLLPLPKHSHLPSKEWETKGRSEKLLAWDWNPDGVYC